MFGQKLSITFDMLCLAKIAEHRTDTKQAREINENRKRHEREMKENEAEVQKSVSLLLVKPGFKMLNI
jgi:hypothetical protein